jgi:hypothetical protein
MTRSIARLTIAGAGALALAATAAPALAGTHPTHPAKTRATTTALTIKATNNPTSADHYKATVVGTLRDQGNGRAANEPVALFERKGSGKAWTDTTQSQTTDANGKVTFTFTQTATNEQYQLRFAGDSTTTPALKKSKSGVISIHSARSTS